MKKLLTLDYVVDKIKSVLNEYDHNSDKKTTPKLIEINVPETQRMSNVSENLIKAYSIALNWSRDFPRQHITASHIDTTNWLK